MTEDHRREGVAGAAPRQPPWLKGREPVPLPFRPKCLYCGKRLRPCTRWEWPVGELRPKSRRVEGYGGYGDNYFCGLNCGHRWAVQFLRAHGAEGERNERK